MAALTLLRQPMRLSIISPNVLKYRHFSFTGQRFAARTQSEPEEVDPAWTPVKYSTSEAASHNARDAVYRVGRWKNCWEYEPQAVTFSVSIMMVYFFILREENDLDEELGKELYERFPEVEISHLKMKGELTPEQAERLAFLQKKLYNK